jgi:SPP1 gp7 family putative phage head morphogenesis protein
MTEPQKTPEKPYVRLFTKNVKKAILHKSLKASPRAETRYVADLKNILAGIHEGTMKALEPILAKWVPEEPEKHRRDARPVRSGVSHVTERVIAGLRMHVARHVGDAFDRMSSEVNKKNAAGMKVIGIDPLWTTPVGRIPEAEAVAVIKKARDENIKLVEDAGRDYAEQVRDVFEDPDNFGLAPDELKQLLLDRGGVSESRAQLIARDQTLKLNSALTKDRHERAGISQYKWSTSLDERVRPMHADLEGTTQSWDDPPVTNEQGEENHPGEDYQCRCIPIPILPGDEDEGT